MDLRRMKYRKWSVQNSTKWIHNEELIYRMAFLCSSGKIVAVTEGCSCNVDVGRERAYRFLVGNLV